jgi:glucose-1-phosphate thymidylyltransferase
MSYILDDLAELGVDEIVFVVGYMREAIESYIADAYPDITAHYVVQEIQDGTAGAVKLAEPFVDEDVLILFVDTLFDAELALVQDVPETTGGIIWAKEVEDYQLYGVILTDEEDHMVRIVEKPSEPISNLANIGLYYIKDWQLLFEGIRHTVDADPGPSGEFYLTDAFQYMVDQGSKIQVAPVAGWYDCGNLATLLDTNRHLLLKGRSGVAESATLEGSTVNEPVRVEEGAVVLNSVLGPNVTVEAGARVENSTVADTILGARCTVMGSTLRESLVGSESTVTAYRGRLDIGDHSEVEGEERATNSKV